MWDDYQRVDKSLRFFFVDVCALHRAVRQWFAVHFINCDSYENVEGRLLKLFRFNFVCCGKYAKSTGTSTEYHVPAQAEQNRIIINWIILKRKHITRVIYSSEILIDARAICVCLCLLWTRAICYRFFFESKITKNIINKHVSDTGKASSSIGKCLLFVNYVIELMFSGRIDTLNQRKAWLEWFVLLNHQYVNQIYQYFVLFFSILFYNLIGNQFTCNFWCSNL